MPLAAGSVTFTVAPTVHEKNILKKGADQCSVSAVIFIEAEFAGSDAVLDLVGGPTLLDRATGTIGESKDKAVTYQFKGGDITTEYLKTHAEDIRNLPKARKITLWSYCRLGHPDSNVGNWSAQEFKQWVTLTAKDAARILSGAHESGIQLRLEPTSNGDPSKIVWPEPK
jgi:hypothetical protein